MKFFLKFTLNSSSFEICKLSYKLNKYSLFQYRRLISELEEMCKVSQPSVLRCTDLRDFTYNAIEQEIITR